MKIGITLNEVVRDYLYKIQLTYEKYSLGKSTVDDVSEITDIEKLEEYFPIQREDFEEQSIKQIVNSLAAMEILGAAYFIDEEFNEEFNDFVYDFYINPKNSITFVSKEFDRGINATLFFLGKTNINIRKIDLVETYNKVWDDYDLIITAEPSIIESKPEGKRVVKIEAPYNKHIEAEETYTKISDFIKKLKEDL